MASPEAGHRPAWTRGPLYYVASTLVSLTAVSGNGPGTAGPRPGKRPEETVGPEAPLSKGAGAPLTGLEAG